MRTIATFTMPEEAYLVRGRLEDVGIAAFVLDEHLVQLNPFYGSAIGGVRLQVGDEDLAEARAFLQADADAVRETQWDDPALTEKRRREQWRHACGWTTAVLLGFPLLLWRLGGRSHRSD